MTENTVYAATCPGGGEHEYSITVVKKPTDTKVGTERYTCVKCGHSYEEVVPGTGHSYTQWKTVQEPTCIGEGIMERYCTTCNETEDEIIPSTGHHHFDSWVTIQTASQTQRGTEERTCSVCGSKEIRAVNIIAQPEDLPDDTIEKSKSKEEAVTQEAVTTPTPTTMPSETLKGDFAGFNLLDLILTIVNILVAGSYYLLIRRDHYVINWDKERKTFPNRLGSAP